MNKYLSVIVVLLSAIVFYLIYSKPPAVPKLPEVQWKEDHTNDSKIYPFSINVSKNVIDSLKIQLKSTTYTTPLIGVNFTYGFDNNQLKKVIDYWLNNYRWETREKLLNSVPHYRTKILGLNIHFIHIKPDQNAAEGKKVLPLLLIHGWPGSVREFYNVFSLLTTPRKEYDFVFEIIAPSLPGYGYSDAATIPGLGPAQIAQVFKLLMERIGFMKFYVQGGDWGAVIGSDMVTLYPKSVIGFHSNLCSMPSTFKAYLQLFIGSFLPDWYVTEKSFKHRIYPLSNMFSYLIEETGYFHLQATKPDTVGVALSNSPAGLAAYILEKFSTWENYNFRNQPDGGFDFENIKGKHYSIDDLLDNVMIYWTTHSITTSMRLYSESLTKKRQVLKLDNIPTNVPTVCASYPYDLYYFPETLLKYKYTNLLYQSHMPRGGHFAAFEQPQLFSDDVWKAICNIENVVINKQSKIC